MMSAWSGGGSPARSSNEVLRIAPAPMIAAPCTGLAPPTSLSPMAIKSAKGSAPCRNTDVSPFFGFGMNAAGLTADELECPDEVRNLATSSASATSSGSPEGSVMAGDAFDFLNNARRELASHKLCHRVSTVSAIDPGVGQAVGFAGAQCECPTA